MDKENMADRKCIIWGAGYCGGIALDAYGSDSVVCFGDSDSRNVGLSRWGKSIVSYEKMIEFAKTENLRVIIASENFGEEMKQRLLQDGITDYDLFRAEYAREIVNDRCNGVEPLAKHYAQNVQSLIHPELSEFKDCHAGKRIFLVGNGPSLVHADLDCLYRNHEICFGFNGIYKIYDRTEWRPDYYGIVDYYGFQINKDVVNNLPGTHFLWDIFEPWMDDCANDANYYFHYERNDYTSMPNFSEDITKGINLGYSVLYDVGLQFAHYMGASEIYIIGADHNYPNKKSHKGNHFEGYMPDIDDRVVFYPIENVAKAFEYEKVEAAFRKADNYSKNHGFKIYNATRGGKLEIFERIDFDQLF